MEKIRKLVLGLVILAPLHVAEQLLTGIEDFYDVRGHLAAYYRWFDPGFADSATAILVTILATILSLLLYALLCEGKPRLLVVGLFGLFGAQAIHHVFEALIQRRYNPGLITAVPYLIVGNMLVKAVWKELRKPRATSDPSAALAQAGVPACFT